MNKQEARELWDEVKDNLQKIKDAGWVSVKCDNYDAGHSLNLRSRSVYQKDGHKLCRDCVLQELGLG